MQPKTDLDSLTLSFKILTQGGKAMLYSSWRGVVGLIKPGVRPGSIEEFIRLLPEGIGVMPRYLGIRKGTKEEFLAIMEKIKELVAELAEMNVDLISAEGAPPFMIRGH